MGNFYLLLFDVVCHYLASCFPCLAHISDQADVSHPCRQQKWLNCGHLFKVTLLPPPDESPPSASHITSPQSHTDVVVVVVVDNERMH